MFWRKKKTYGTFLPPLTKKMEQFTPKEAQDYFNWFMCNLDTRIEHLRSYTKLDLDYSPDSLVGLWSWFYRTAEIEKTPEEQEKGRKIALEEANWPLVPVERNMQFTLETMCIIRDIGVYLGEVLVKNHPAKLYWNYYNSKSKKDPYANRPLIFGFPPGDLPTDKTGVRCDVIQGVHCQASRLLEMKGTRRDLVDFYTQWAELFQ